MGRPVLTILIFGALWATGLKAQDNSASPQRTTIVNVPPPVPTGPMANAADFLRQAHLAETDNNYEDALNMYVKAAAEYQVARQYRALGDVYTEISNMHYNLNRFNEAVQVLLHAAIPAFNRAHFRPGLTATYGRLGRVYLAYNKPVEALWFYSQQGLEGKQQNNAAAVMDAYIGMAYANILRREYKLAGTNLADARSFMANTPNAANTLRINRAQGYLESLKGVR